MTQEWKHVQLRNFRQSELLFDEKETRAILKFFFPIDGNQIDAAPITDPLRELSQGLLVAAADATYAMGWLQATFKSVANPRSSVKSALQKLARNAVKHWFKNLKSEQSLSEIKIYESVRAELSRNFRSPFQIILLAKPKSPNRQTLMACINCARQKNQGSGVKDEKKFIFSCSWSLIHRIHNADGLCNRKSKNRTFTGMCGQRRDQHSIFKKSMPRIFVHFSRDGTRH